jgi:hypothetical protein
MSSKEIKKKVLASLHQKFLDLGFRKRKYGIFACDASKDVLGLVGLNTARRGVGVLEINPVVGVRNQRVERLVAELEGSVFDEVSPFDASANVGYLSPASSYRAFLFADGEPLDKTDKTVDQLAEAVRNFGLPFIDANVPLPSLLETMRSGRFGIQFVAAYRIPAALHLLGRDREAEAFLDSELTKLNAAHDPAAERFRRFAACFRERLLNSSHN